MSGVYVHIPFCRQSCVYCNFYFRPGKRQSPELHSALLTEIALKAAELPRFPETIYFGGGTPSYVEPAYIAEIIQALLRHSGGEGLTELTLEANPDDMNEANLKAWKAMGVNRLSVGVQSFYDSHLRWMNRAHSAEEAKLALKLASGMGFELSLDLIFGLPDCSDEQWLNNLETAFSYDISHLSCYGLTLEENTPWSKLIKRGAYQAPDDAQAARQFGLCMDYMQEKGWWHYEISNYCKPGKTALHNTAYWQGKHYTGIGPSAHSYNGSSRSWNVADLSAYIQAMAEGRLPQETEETGKSEMHNEYVMTSLRTMWGCDLNKLSAFGFMTAQLQKQIDFQLSRGMLEQKEGVIYLSREGKYFADAIASSLFAGKGADNSEN